jgi:hypothetical protein
MSQNNGIKLLPVHEARLSERAKESQLIIDVPPGIYEIFGSKRNVLLAIADPLKDPNNGFSGMVMVLGGNRVAGICT